MYGSNVCPDMYARPASYTGRHAISFCQVHERICWGSQHVFLLLCRVSPISVWHGEAFLTGVCIVLVAYPEQRKSGFSPNRDQLHGSLSTLRTINANALWISFDYGQAVVWWKLICLYCSSMCASWRIYVMWFFRYPMRSFCISCNENIQTSHPSICKSHEVIHNLIFRSQYSFPIQPWWFCWPGLWEERQ